MILLFIGAYYGTEYRRSTQNILSISFSSERASGIKWNLEQSSQVFQSPFHRSYCSFKSVCIKKKTFNLLFIGANTVDIKRRRSMELSISFSSERTARRVYRAARRAYLSISFSSEQRVKVKVIAAGNLSISFSSEPAGATEHEVEFMYNFQSPFHRSGARHRWRLRIFQTISISFSSELTVRYTSEHINRSISISFSSELDPIFFGGLMIFAFQSPFHRSHFSEIVYLPLVKIFQSPFHRSGRVLLTRLNERAFNFNLLFIGALVRNLIGQRRRIIISISFSSELEVIDRIVKVIEDRFQSPFHRSLKA